ncbi:MAG: dihydroxy-acid dehydratase, partial [Candidatus Saganbacteria bacterium]|nr:dihydroxy-acid dehydratase [Candidatus Saganbacteria bacterium]
ISPEAAEGGLIALVEEGDIIDVDIPGKKLTLKVGEDEIKRRKVLWKAPEPKIKKGYVGRYAKIVSSASTGAVFKE